MISEQLKSSVAVNCGSPTHRKGRPILDLAGRKFGRLTVTEPTDRRDTKGSVFWRCQCVCGQVCEVSADGLLNGNYRSCGCLQKELQQELPNRLHRIDHTCVEWLEKRKHRRDNSSGFRGVYPQGNGRYRVIIGFKRRRFFVGSYENFEQAVQARLDAEELIHDGFVRAYQKWCQEGAEGPLIFDVSKEAGKLVVRTERQIDSGE